VKQEITDYKLRYLLIFFENVYATLYFTKYQSKMKKHFFWILFLFSVFQIAGKSQFAEQYCLSENRIMPADSNKLFLKISNANFLKDNEYFNNIVEGYTLLGYWITPSFEYHIGSKTTLNGGIHLLKFSGRDKFFKVLPVLTFTEQFSPLVSMSLGTIQNNRNHNMPEPLWDPESFYFKQAQEGLQFLLNYSRFKSDLWANWDNFIWYGDTLQEEITSGTSSELTLYKGSKWSLILPFQTIITHHGGQINRPKKAIETLMNLGSGLYLEYSNEDKFIRYLRIAPQVFLYKQNTSYIYEPYEKAPNPYKNGWAVYPNILLSAGPFLFKTGWWYTDKFIGPRGEAMYQSKSTLPLEERIAKGYDEVHRNLIIGKLGYYKYLGKDILITGGFEGYYDLHSKLFDYNFSISLHYNGKFFLKDFN
jgi:hypothetical protein